MAPPAEISIPTTSTTTPSDGKPYTLYNITLRLPLRSFVVQKRYSDFVTLHTSLTSTVGSAPPAPLPSKSWFRSTVSSPELTEKRRQELETYLRAIAETPDRRWRDTPVWRAFLNLPSSYAASGSAASSSGIVAGGRGGVAAAAAGKDSLIAAADAGQWLDLHREMKAALQEAKHCLARRDAAADSTARVEAGAQAKKALVKAGGLLVGLNDGLRILKENGKLGDGEIRRRRDLLAAAREERDGLDKLSASLASSASGAQGPAAAGDRAALLSGAGTGSSRHGGRVLGAPLPETEATRELDNEGVLMLQRQLMKDQDQDVEALAKIIRRQKEMGLAIKDEVDRQIEYMDRMNEDVDRLDSKLGVAKERTKRLG
ncbi:hypothetical protein DL546_004063 [Coniochaeta pulveracea]|uniref:Uncharacterized protein n=1 Tax=Coniochaeta pulveracea TaxID=177199 RepID=A0A420Y2Z5_9PEZI|nr:hypothetical protein DL546_004063 [Coniochaeta pulveracea]